MRTRQFIDLTIAAMLTLASAGVTGVAQASPGAAALRPVGVPEGYVITPFGYFHPSCVNQLADDDVVQQDQQTITHADGFVEKVEACEYAHYAADGREVTRTEPAVVDPKVNGWIASASVVTTSSYGYLYAFWQVPPAPAAHDGQTLFFFNGLEDINDTKTILQPVLGWNSDFPSAWGIASWNCCVNGKVNEATPRRVDAGDLIFGYILNKCSSEPLTCPSWHVVAWDLTNGQSSQLENTSNYAETFNWAFGGVLEVYNIVRCGDYPNGPADHYRGGGPQINFYNLGLFDRKLVKIVSPGWKVATASDLSPSCGNDAATAEEVVISY